MPRRPSPVPLGNSIRPATAINNNNWIFADAFTVTSTVTASGLGYYADPSNGQVDANQVALYKCDTAGCFTTATLLATATVTNIYPLNGHFRYVTISPVTLTPGDYEVSGVSHGDNYTWNDIGFHTDPSIVYPLSMTRWQLSGGNSPDFLNYVNNNEIETDGFHGPNVYLGSAGGFTGTPEPASWALMIAGFGLVGGALAGHAPLGRTRLSQTGRLNPVNRRRQRCDAAAVRPCGPSPPPCARACPGGGHVRAGRAPPR